MFVEKQICFNNILMFSKPLNWALAVSGALVLGVGALFIKNLRQQKSIEPLSKQQLIYILKLIRRNRYTIYKQIVTLVINMARQMRGQLTVDMIEQLLNGNESPVKIKEEFENIEQRVCTQRKTTIDAFYQALKTYEKDPDVYQLKKLQTDDYRTCLNGRLPIFQVTVPAEFNKERFLATQNQLTKKTYLHQVAILKKMSEYTEEQLRNDPQLLAEFNNHDTELEEILIAEGLGSELEPPYAVYEKATQQFTSDVTVRGQIAKIEQGYQQIMSRYAMKIQNRTIRPDEMTQMEDEIIWFDPISA